MHEHDPSFRFSDASESPGHSTVFRCCTVSILKEEGGCKNICLKTNRLWIILNSSISFLGSKNRSQG